MDLIIRRANIEGEIVDIGIKGNEIMAVKEAIFEESHHEIDAEEKVAIPGFVDAHLHLDKSMLNEQVPYEDVSGPEKGALTRELKQHFTVENIKSRAERVIQHAIKSGSLHIRTNVDVDPLVGVQGIEALMSLKEKYKEFLTIQVTAFSQEGFVHYQKTTELLEKALEMGADLVGGHTIIDGDRGKEHIDIILDLANKYDVPAEFHVDESGLREHYLLPYLAEQVIEKNLKGRVTAIHNCTLNALNEAERVEAYNLMKESKLYATVAPTAISTRDLAPVKEMLKAGIPIAIGSDNIRDFFNPLGSGDVKQVALLLAYVQRFFKEDEVKEIWKAITRGGAKSLGIVDYGIIEGNTADITILDELNHTEVIAKQAQPFFVIRKGKDYTQNLLTLSEEKIQKYRVGG